MIGIFIAGLLLATGACLLVFAFYDWMTTGTALLISAAVLLAITGT